MPPADNRKGIVMAVQVKRITLWRRDVENRPGALAGTLSPLAEGGVDLQVLMGYRDPSVPGRAVLELYPVSGRKAAVAAQQAGLAASSIPTLLVEGDNRAGLGHALARAMADARINIAFLVAQVVGKRYSAVIGFENDGEAKRAAVLIKKVEPRPSRK
jgi:hypothetical protein